MISKYAKDTIDRWKFSPSEKININATERFNAVHQLRDKLGADKLTYDEVDYILSRLLEIGIVIYDKGFRTNEKFDWSKYLGDFYKKVRYLVSCELSAIDEPGVRKRNVIVDWNGLDVETLHNLVMDELGEEYKGYSVYITNLTKVDLISKE